MPHRFLLTGLLAGATALPGYAQAVRTQPYNAQLRTDPAVGNVQGIQRYGRPLRTDPDEGEGFSYHVYPVAEPSAVVLTPEQAPAGRAAGGTGSPAVFRSAEVGSREQALTTEAAQIGNLAKAAEDANQALHEALKRGADAPTIRRLRVAAEEAQKALQDRRNGLRKGVEAFQQSLQVREAMQATGLGAAYAAPPAAAPVSPYPPPFIPTEGMRLPPPPALLPPGVALSPFAQAIAFNPKTPGTPLDIYHQPLIQVKVRVVEVDRADQLLVSSVLDFIRMPFAANPNTLITGNNVNHDRRNLSGGTRFPLPDDLITFTGNTLATLTGSGALVNLTEGNINYIARLLATEFQSDVVTAPEVVTLNGQNVEFISGQKVPFELGQNVIQGNNNNVQQFFYKHVGTFISVTPRIVNWGALAEGGGKAPLVDPDVLDWPAFVRGVLELQEQNRIQLTTTGLAAALKSLVDKGPEDFLVPVETRGQLLKDLSRYAREDLTRLGLPVAEKCCPGGAGGCGAAGCDWRPEDCTIDLEVVVRLSDTGAVTLTAARGGGTPELMNVTAEKNVRGIADIVQVQSGHGVVMGGLIGERDVKDVNKVPVLGDIPVLGFFFRSKATNREKTEVVVFIEAKVLDPCPNLARAQSANDFRLGQPYLAGEFLDNPLEYGMYRAGFGPYLPPHSLEEKVFWERLGRKVRKIVTTVDDAFE